jgi:3-oxoacyl-[acyl-carrier protein] reductase
VTVARVALVTGASRGIGAAIAARLESDGVHVLKPSRAELDLEQRESISRFLASGAAAKVDILINNAGINDIRPLEEIDDATWDRMVQVNLRAPLALLQGVASGMKARGWGRVVNIGSLFGQVTREGRGSYSAVKAGLSGLTRTAAVELAPFGVLVNAVCPGYVETALTRKNNTPEALERIRQSIPLGRLAEPRDIADCVAFFASEQNRYLTGQSILVDGGFSCL